MCLSKDVLNITLDLDQVLHKRALSVGGMWMELGEKLELRG